jgi:hypothetical protein
MPAKKKCSFPQKFYVLSVGLEASPLGLEDLPAPMASIHGTLSSILSLKAPKFLL